MIAWCKKHWFISGFLAFIAVYAVVLELSKPRINPNPQRKIVMSGVFPYDRGFELKLDISFSTENPDCKETLLTLGLFPAATVRQTWETEVPVKKVGENRYAAELAFDHVLPGRCQWTYAGMAYNISSKEYPSESNRGLGPIPQLVKAAHMNCELLGDPAVKRQHPACFVVYE
ncbi:MAG: hypothetical protein RIR70_1492, partial [Pseudomonadota bacterium]